MGINQAIYTSSARGISKGGGMGIHTYNRSCIDAELRRFERSYCQYYFNGQIKSISELPRKIVYGKTEAGRYMEACITYLGKDYDKVRGRMGNLLSHMYSFSTDALCVYPMQLFGSPDYRVSIEQEEFDGTKPVDYLPEIDEVRCGTNVNAESIRRFLSEGRVQMFCHMLSAVLRRENIHKIILYDTHENIVMWLGAIEFALPLQCAREVSFSSYEKNPLMSEFDIRGAVVGMSDGNCRDYAAGGQFYVFDGIHKDYPKFDISEDYFQYVLKIRLTFLQESPGDFFEFIEQYAYEKADCDIFRGFKLYQLIYGKTEEFREEDCNAALEFQEKYGNKETYCKLLTGLAEKLEKNVDLSEEILTFISIFLSGYFKKKLTSKELLYGLELLGRLESDIWNHGNNSLKGNKMWQLFYGIFLKYQQEYMEVVRMFFIKGGFYQRLAEFEACLYRNEEHEDDIRQVKSLFLKDWNSIVPAEFHHFDCVVCVVVANIEKYKEDEKRYGKAVDLFLLLQDLGKGHIAGEGCEQLIRMIEELTSITGKRQFSKKRRRDSDVLDEKQARCAFEILNYTKKNRSDLPIAKIRLLPLGKCIAKAYDDEISLLKSKELSIYKAYPITIEDVSDEELEKYINQLAEIVNTMETSTDEYSLLLKFWYLDKTQKALILRIFMEHEVDYFRKEREISGLGALVGAIMEVGDEEYQQALGEYVFSMKDSHRDKISRAIQKKYRKNELYHYWMKMEKVSKDRKKKKIFFPFGR